MHAFEFNYHIPTKLVFGAGRLNELPDNVSGLGHRCLIMCGVASARASGLVDRVRQLLEGANVDSTTFDGIQPNPSAESVESGAKAAHAFGPDFIVAVGAASVMDAAKAISLACTHSADFWEYRITGSKGIQEIRDVLIPIVVIPTAGGTGSEVSPAAVITKDRHKEVIVSPYMYPKLAIVDPELHVRVPRDLTAYMGVDAFVQALETYVSAKSTPLSDVFAAEAMRLALAWLPRAVERGDDVEARSFMALAGILSSFAINLAGVGAVHALSDPLSGRYEIAHGLALAMLLPAVIEFNLDVARPQLSLVSSLMEKAGYDAAPAESGEPIILQIAAFLEAVRVTSRLSDFGITDVEIRSFASEAFNPDMSTNPKATTLEQVIELYRKSL